MTFSPALVSEEHPLDLHDQIPAAVLALNEPNARAEQPVDVELTVQKDGSDFIVHGWARHQRCCLRCARRDAEMFPQPIRATIEQRARGSRTRRSSTLRRWCVRTSCWRFRSTPSASSRRATAAP
ncbi:MAG: hypothetical protein WDO13_03010 [Verrucomicrobiota bacterium]